MESKKVQQVIIIGAGPAGISLAYHLKQNGVSSLLLEASSSPGNSWREMPDFLSLISLWKSNYLIKAHRFNFSPIKQVGAKDFASYLRNFAKNESLSIELNTKATKVSKDESIFRIETQKGALYSKLLVNATGYYSYPFTPNYPGLEESHIKLLHFKDYRNSNSVNGKRVLVVGARLSAGQIIKDLYPLGFDLSLSSRSPLEFMSPPPAFNLALLLNDYVELISSKFSNKWHSTSAPMLYEAKKCLTNGSVKLYPGIKSINKESVTFDNGHTEPFDCIIFATGFRPNFKHLENCVEINQHGLPKLSESFESLYCNNLFFLGLDQQNNIQSRFLRGIRKDSKALASILSRRIQY